MTPRSPAKAGAQERASAAAAAPWTPASAGEQLNPRTDYLIRLGDDSLVLGQRLSEWCGHGPVLEVDISLANLALDLVGQATLLLNEAGDGDQLAFHRDVLDFRNCLLVEQPNGDFAQTVARQLLFSTWQHLLYGRLVDDPDETLAGVAQKAVKETAYHREHAGRWTVRLGDGTEESHRRMQTGLERMWPYVDEMLADAPELRPEWETSILDVLTEATLERPHVADARGGGRAGRHEHLGELLAEMQQLRRALPEAVW
jgi:ring-1,2-phenylacetyl-CoA epoxidase subunit PaaC